MGIPAITPPVPPGFSTAEAGMSARVLISALIDHLFEHGGPATIVADTNRGRVVLQITLQDERVLPGASSH
ncbi:MAG: hypothetical protein KIT35_21930 [Piscinibacter sp.]|uniref:hypothetical protein n=1 Tax=Piscinibacter sp. TaxID=1903157 RepID=UPI0025858BBD|nr:hypothetical protein [Piscinibacter sp.]MCW5666500.1 hypothetical protein [Piscinibacter sp.]